MLSIGINTNDLGWPWTAKTPLSQKYTEPSMKISTKIDRHH